MDPAPASASASALPPLPLDPFQSPHYQSEALELAFSGPSALLQNRSSRLDSVGPGSYFPNDSLTARSAPKPTFGRSHRFLPSAVLHISRHHNADLLCKSSPGPKYYTQNQSVTYRRAPTVSFGGRPRRIDARLEALTAEQADVGPAAYTPKLQVIRPSPPIASFSRSSRFNNYNSIYILNNSPSLSTNLSSPRDELLKREAPHYSFGKKNPPRDRSMIKSKPRTSFMTHSIRGGLAKPATLECNIGPGDYEPRYELIGSKSSHAHSMGHAERFVKPGVMFLSADHSKSGVGAIGPGPKYLPLTGTIGSGSNTNNNNSNNSNSGSKMARGNSLQWVP